MQNLKCEIKNKISITAVIALTLSIVSVLAALWADKLAFVSLQNSYTPWLRIEDVRTFITDPDTIEIKYVCKNFANGPALNLDIKITIFGKSTTERLYDSEASMPNSEGEYSSYVSLHGSYKPEDIIERLGKGESPIIFDICFEDVLGRKIKVHQECKSIKGILRTTVYKVDGLVSSVWKVLFNVFTF